MGLLKKICLAVGFIAALSGHALAAGVDKACVGKTVSPSKPMIQPDGSYLFQQDGYGAIATTLIGRQQYTVIDATPQPGGKWCLVTISVNGQVNGNSYNSVIIVSAF